MKPLLIGMISSANGTHALYPLPEDSAGNRLWKLVNARTNASMRDYLDAFERRSLVRGQYNKQMARIAAQEIIDELRSSGRTVILLGNSVRLAFNRALDSELPSVLIHPTQAAGCTWRQIPHMNNGWYDQAENRMLVELLMEELFAKNRQRGFADVTE